MVMDGGLALGLITGRLRGGFLSSPLPGLGNGRPTPLETSDASTSSTTTTTPTSQDTPFRIESSANVTEALNTIVCTCKNVQEQVKKLDYRIGSLEREQTMLSSSLKFIVTRTYACSS